ncbi:hypothetical protein Trydic_g5885 [Trypoxylus dichotomus]
MDGQFNLEVSARLNKEAPPSERSGYSIKIHPRARTDLNSDLETNPARPFAKKSVASEPGGEKSKRGGVSKANDFILVVRSDPEHPLRGGNARLLDCY